MNTDILISGAKLINRNIVESISPRHVGRLLDEADLKPHQIRYWLTPSNNEDFDEKVRDISELYITAPERVKQGERTLSFGDTVFSNMFIYLHYKYYYNTTTKNYRYILIELYTNK